MPGPIVEIIQIYTNVNLDTQAGTTARAMAKAAIPSDEIEPSGARATLIAMVDGNAGVAELRDMQRAKMRAIFACGGTIANVATARINAGYEA